ncbi:hypothetical protein [Sulfurovum sp. NBC37-1]|uniref:hypothetical protein n=1 Tax=Sulfurovum sp. (strain NBC37-1) TaxID=387093 RepID=UPI0005A0D39A|nr:hypothetical protein [Sulfurovum sp. NBC37-1]
MHSKKPAQGVKNSKTIYNITEAVSIKNISQTIDVTGKQRMYTQRIFKDYSALLKKAQVL